MVESLVLTPDFGEGVELKLNKERQPYVAEAIVNVNKKVYEDKEYTITLNTTEPIADAVLYLNDEKIDAVYRDNEIILRGEFTRELFSGQLGFVQLSLAITDEENVQKCYYSEFASVLIPQNRKNRYMEDMLNYVYEHQSDYLKSKVATSAPGKAGANVYNDFRTRIILLEDIANIYETSYSYFKSSCKYKLEAVDVIDRVEKLQNVGAKTIQYMTQHPEYLRKEVTGIRYGKSTYLPDKTLTVQNRATRDIYENRVVLGFLTRVIHDANDLKDRLTKQINAVSAGSNHEDGYIVSSFVLYQSAKAMLHEYWGRLNEAIEKLNNLRFLYHQILDIEINPCVSKPNPSAIFMSVPQYNQIYRSIINWFGKIGYELKNEKVVHNLLSSSSIYETYVLVKLLNNIRELGFELVSEENVTYSSAGLKHYKNKEFNNTYVFIREDVRVTLYYEPVIYSSEDPATNNISLYRNNTISFTYESDVENRHCCYTPDYIIKIEKDGQEKYVICDAKYTYLKRVRNQHVPELSYKYLFSLSPRSKNASIIGINIFYGVTDEEHGKESFYNLEKETRINPFFELIPLSEELNEEEQRTIAIKIMQDAIG
ncbi:MAG: DUF2357 domain-containing protein [Pseudobutyrivibrio sp.]|nr:DUF2357 domain-containing protein [Pseudobutyrivibrio sp.]